MLSHALKSAIVINASAATNGATATGMIDTKNYDWLTLDILGTTSNNSTNKPSVFKLQESDDTNITNAVDITKFVGGGVGGWTVPTQPTQTQDVKLYKMNVDTRHRKRYLFLSISPVTTQTFTAIANLGKAEQSPIAAADANVLALVEG